MKQKFSLGIDIGGTNIDWGIVSDSGEIVFQKRYPSLSFDTVETLAKQVLEDIQNHSGYSLAQLDGIGIGAPSANTQTGCIHHSANLHWKGIVPITSVFEQIIHLPCHIANDANATAFGEKIYGAAKGMNNFAVITLGTGVGSGIVCNGQMIEGFDGNGGEFGHIIVDFQGRECGCGRKGCLETYTSATGIKNTAILLAESGEFDTSLSQLILAQSTFDSKTVYEYVLQNDSLAVAVFQQTGLYLGRAIANLVTLLGLEAVFLFGGPVNAGDFLIKPTQESFNEDVIFYYKNLVKILPSKIKAQNAAILGAASLSKL